MHRATDAQGDRYTGQQMHRATDAQGNGAMHRAIHVYGKRCTGRHVVLQTDVVDPQIVHSMYSASSSVGAHS